MNLCLFVAHARVRESNSARDNLALLMEAAVKQQAEMMRTRKGRDLSQPDTSVHIVARCAGDIVDFDDVNNSEIFRASMAGYNLKKTPVVVSCVDFKKSELDPARSRVLLPQTIFIVGLVGLLYAGYIWIQSTEWSNPIEPLALNLMNSTIWGISLEFLNFVVFYKLAGALTSFENHRTVEAHERNLIAKLFVFFYIDCFLWFFLLAFFQLPFGRQIQCAPLRASGFRLHACA